MPYDTLKNGLMLVQTAITTAQFVKIVFFDTLTVSAQKPHNSRLCRLMCCAWSAFTTPTLIPAMSVGRAKPPLKCQIIHLQIFAVLVLIYYCEYFLQFYIIFSHALIFALKENISEYRCTSTSILYSLVIAGQNLICSSIAEVDVICAVRLLFCIAVKAYLTVVCCVSVKCKYGIYVHI